jgi:hypothetical protein
MMNTLRKYIETILIFFIFVTGFLNYRSLTIIGTLIFFIYTIFNAVIEILSIKKAEKVDAFITSFEENKNEDYTETAKHNYLLNLEIQDKRYDDSQTIQVYALLHKKPQNGQKVKVMKREEDIRKAQFHKGDEISDQFFTIVVFSLIIAFGLYFYLKFMPLKS